MNSEIHKNPQVQTGGWGDMAHKLKALVSLAENLDSTVIPAPRDSTPSFGLHGYCMHMVHRHTGKQTLIHIK